MRKFVAWGPLLAAVVALPLCMDAAAQTVSPGIAATLKAAQDASKANRWADCLSNLGRAEASAGVSAYDRFVINELRGFCALRSNDLATAARAYEANLGSQFAPAGSNPARLKTLTQLYYNQRNYAKAVEFGQRAIKENAADADVYLLVSQAYYEQRDYRNAKTFTGEWITSQERRGQRPRENAIQIYLTSCINLKDDACATQGFEKLVTYYPKPEGWANLMQSLFRSRSDAAVFNAYRLATEVNAISSGSDYTEMAQIAIERGLPAEAQKVLETAFARKVFTGQRDIDRNTRLLNTAKERVAAARGQLGRNEQATASGDALVRAGEAYMSFGQHAQAVAAIQKGITKGGLSNVDEAQLLLGIAQLKAGNKAEASRAFRAVKGTDADLQRVAKLWALRAQ